MDVAVKKGESGESILEMGSVSLVLSDDAIASLQSIIHERLSKSSSVEEKALEKKLSVYRALAEKMRGADARILQKLAVDLTPEQLVTLVRLCDGEDLYKKLMNNMSKSNSQQFEDDYKLLNKITVHQACIYMEQIVPKIKQAAQEQKLLQQESTAINNF